MLPMGEHNYEFTKLTNLMKKQRAASLKPYKILRKMMEVFIEKNTPIMNQVCRCLWCINFIWVKACVNTF